MYCYWVLKYLVQTRIGPGQFHERRGLGVDDKLKNYDYK